MCCTMLSKELPVVVSPTWRIAVKLFCDRAGARCAVHPARAPVGRKVEDVQIPPLFSCCASSTSIERELQYCRLVSPSLPMLSMGCPSSTLQPLNILRESPITGLF